MFKTVSQRVWFALGLVLFIIAMLKPLLDGNGGIVERFIGASAFILMMWQISGVLTVFLLKYTNGAVNTSPLAERKRTLVTVCIWIVAAMVTDGSNWAKMPFGAVISFVVLLLIPACFFWFVTSGYKPILNWFKGV